MKIEFINKGAWITLPTFNPNEKEKKKFYFEYDLATGKLTELKDYEPEKPVPHWATVFPEARSKFCC